MHIKTLNNNVIIQHLPEFNTRSASGLTLSTSSSLEAYGTVLSVPENTDVKEGQTVVFPKNKANMIFISGEKLISLKLDDILGVIEE